MSLGSKVLVIATLVLLIFGVQACSRSQSTPTTIPSTPTATPTPTPVNPRALLLESGRQMADLHSFHFRLEHRAGSTLLLPNLSIKRAEGDVVKPDKISAQFTGTFGGFAIKSSLITLGEASFMSNPLTGEWDRVPAEVSPLGFFNPRRGIADVMSQVEGPLLQAGDGHVLRLTGRLPAEALVPLLGSTVQGTTVAVELMIRAKDLYLLEAVFTGPVKPGELDSTVRVVTLSRFNEPVSIVPPQ